MLLLTSCAYSSTPETEIKFDYVPQGYVTPAPGYWLDVPTGRNLLHMARTYREKAEYWEREHGALADEFKNFVNATDTRFTNLETLVENERKGWKREIRKARALGFGIFAGAGYGTGGDVQGVIGAGLVWRLW